MVMRDLQRCSWEMIMYAIMALSTTSSNAKYSHGIWIITEINMAMMRVLNDSILVYFINGSDLARKASRNACGISFSP